MHRFLAVLVSLALLLATVTVQADIFRWDNGQVIQGTEGITPGPGVQLSGWNQSSHSLSYADFSGKLDLREANFQGSWLENAQLDGANLSNATLADSTLTGAGLRSADLTKANLTSANLSNAYLADSTLTNANLAGAVVMGASFWRTTSHGFTQSQLASTQSYGDKNLSRVVLGSNDLTGWNFTNQSLSEANLMQSTLTNADLTGAVVTGTSFYDTTNRGFTKDQLYSTASYRAKDLHGIILQSNDLSGWDFSGQSLANAQLWDSTLTNADLSMANLESAVLQNSDLTNADLSGANLTNAGLWLAKLTNADLSGANLTNADLSVSTWANAKLAGAVILGATLSAATRVGFTKEQLYSTSSYGAKNLERIGLHANDLSGWDFAGQNLAHADFLYSVFENANLTSANLSNARVESTNLKGADLTGANLTSANLGSATLTNANLSGANFTGADLFGASLSGADTRGALSLNLTNLTAAASLNAIMPDGRIANLFLPRAERLVVRDDDGVPEPPPLDWMVARPPIHVTIHKRATMAEGGVLQLRFDADPWDSLIEFEPGIPVRLGGTLELTFAQDVDSAGQVGRTLDLFDWTGVSPTGAFTVASLYDWDLSHLYTTGDVTLLAAGGVIAGDANGDGQVDATDFGTLKEHFGATGSKAEGDANGDGKIDLGDFGLLKLNFGKVAAAVPEPATVTLSALGFALVLFGRHRVLGRSKK